MEKLTNLPLLTKEQELWGKINYICKNYNPYAQNISPEIKELLQQINIDPEKETPFTITNKLLTMLDELSAYLI